jgi:hypothetical protein
MCDYSLANYGSRPAREFERYVTTRFSTGSVGLASPGDCGTAVCVQYDTRLVVEGVPREVQAAFAIGPIAEATFIRLDHGPYRDGLRFDNGRRISIQQLGIGVGAIVTRVLEKAEPVSKRFGVSQTA